MNLETMMRENLPQSMNDSNLISLMAKFDLLLEDSEVESLSSLINKISEA